MKIIYRQLLAFFAVAMVILTLFALSFLKLSQDWVYQDTWSRLENYARSIRDETISLNSKGQISLDNSQLKTTQNFLHNQRVNFTIYKNRDTVLYPSSGFKFKIKERDWKRLQRGETIRRKKDIGGRVHTRIGLIGHRMDNDAATRAAQNLSGDVTDVFVPYFDTNGHLIGVVNAGTMVSGVEETLQKIQHNLVIAMLLIGTLAPLLCFVLAYATTKRANQVRQAARKVARGDFEVTVPIKKKSEIDGLARDFNTMTQSLKRSRQAIEEQEEKRERFMADVAHEMRTPLTTINGLLEGLIYDAIPEESKEQSLELMQSETKRLIRLVNENLDYEKIRNGQIILFKKKFDAVQVIRNVASQLKDKAAAKHDEIELNLPKKMLVYADNDRFIQIIFNITQNAVQFTDHGKIYISAERGYRESIFRVSDEGIGMSKEQISKIWDRYYKADSSRSAKYGESGLGLPIVHQLMQLHNGEIRVTSKLGKGTTFTLVFPDPEDETLDN